MKRNSSCANPVAKSVGVSGQGPRSNATTFKPASHSCCPMMAPVQPKPTNTASTGLRVVAISSLPSGAALESYRWKRHTLAVASYPILVVIVSPWKADHLPCAHILVAAIDGIGEIAFLGILQKHGEERFSVDSTVELHIAALQPFQQFVLIGGGELCECRGA